jgi:RNA polymerase sigma-70 factor (ECF subfamily)
MADQDEVREWINLAKKGDDDAFTNLVEAYQVKVHNLCYRMLGDPSEAEDAAQETFLKAYRGLKIYDPSRSFSTWLLSIASHHCIDRLRRRRILPLSFDELLPSQEKPDASPGPETVMTIHERQIVVRELLHQLGTRDRAAVVLRYWNDLSYHEIAEILSLSIPAVKSRLHRARKELARFWMEQESAIFTSRGRRDEASAI